MSGRLLLCLRESTPTNASANSGDATLTSTIMRNTGRGTTLRSTCSKRPIRAKSADAICNCTLFNSNPQDNQQG